MATVMLILGFLGTILYSFRKILADLEKYEVEKLRIKSIERVELQVTSALREIALKEQEVKRDVAILQLMISAQETAFLKGDFKESTLLRYECEIFYRTLLGKYGENTIRYLEGKK
jgi:hypothetical protein